MPEETAEKAKIVTSAAKAVSENRGLTAALEALRHPKTDLIRSL